MKPVVGKSTDPDVAGVTGESSTFNGVFGITTANGHSGVAGVCDTGGGNGVYGRSKRANGVIGFSSADGHSGVAGANDEGTGNGVYGRSARSDGVIGITTGDGKAGVAGVCDTGRGNGVYGRSKSGLGVYGEAHEGGAGVWGEHKAGGIGVVGISSGIGVYGKGARLAAQFEGNVEVTGDIRFINADCAEEFDIATDAPVEPGTVMVLGESGELVPSDKEYDKRVAGVVSGAGKYRPALVLDRNDSQRVRQPISLVGKVYCKVDASRGAIETGDLLTPSSTPGCAMKAQDPARAFGAVVGKALHPLRGGLGLIPILIALQ